MLVDVSLSINGQDAKTAPQIFELEGRFREFGARAGNMTEPLTRSAELLHMHLEAAYTMEGTGGGSGPWAPLTRDYGAWKHRRGPGVPKLVGLRPLLKGTREHPTRPQSYEPSGRMRRQILMPVENKTTWHIGPRNMRYQPLSNIAIYHQTGTRKMVARPPVDPPRVWLSEIDASFRDWLGNLERQAGL